MPRSASPPSRSTPRDGDLANRNPDKTLAMYAKQATLDLTAPHPIVRAPCAETFDPREPQPLIDIAARYGAIKATFPAAEMIWR
jgi:hypothetical protein